MRGRWHANHRVDSELNAPFVVSLSNHGRLLTIALMPRGSHFLLRRQKKVTNEEATPTFAPCVTIARFAAKTSRGPKLASAQTTGRVIDVFAANLGVEYTETPSDQYFIASRWAYANPHMIICATG